jgi:hypothetical protein
MSMLNFPHGVESPNHSAHTVRIPKMRERQPQPLSLDDGSLIGIDGV